MADIVDFDAFRRRFGPSLKPACTLAEGWTSDGPPVIDVDAEYHALIKRYRTRVDDATGRFVVVDTQEGDLQ
jgi:hypothetical protein